MLCSLAVPAFGQGPGPTRVQVMAVVLREVAPTIRLVGTVRPNLRTVVASEVAGLVAELPVDVGSAVRKGDLICRLRDDLRRFAYDEAAARLQQLESALVEKEADRRKAEFEARRMASLWKEQRCTEKEYNDSQADLDAADGRARQAARSIEAQRAVMAMLADSVARTRILAPFDGHVVGKRTEIGSWVEQGGAIVELIDLSTARVRVPVPESAAGFCVIGEQVRVQVEALRRSFTGTIARLVPDADERARTFPVEVDIPNASGELRPGMFARAAMPSGPRAAQLLVHKDAVVLRGAQRLVFVVQPGPEGSMAVPMPVEIVAEIEDWAAVTATGLKEGDQVIVRGNEYLFGPTPVVIMAEPGSASSQPDAVMPGDPGPRTSQRVRLGEPVGSAG